MATHVRSCFLFVKKHALMARTPPRSHSGTKFRAAAKFLLGLFLTRPAFRTRNAIVRTDSSVKSSTAPARHKCVIYEGFDHLPARCFRPMRSRATIIMSRFFFIFAELCAMLMLAFFVSPTVSRAAPIRAVATSELLDSIGVVKYIPRSRTTVGQDDRDGSILRLSMGKGGNRGTER